MEESKRPFSRAEVLRRHSMECLNVDVGQADAGGRSMFSPIRNASPGSPESMALARKRALEPVVIVPGDDIRDRIRFTGRFREADRETVIGPVRTTIDAVYDIKTGTKADLADVVKNRPKTAPNAPFGSSDGKFGTRYQAQDYYLPSGKRYFGKSEIFEDMTYIINNAKKYHTHFGELVEEEAAGGPTPARVMTANTLTRRGGTAGTIGTTASIGSVGRMSIRSSNRIDSTAAVRKSVVSQAVMAEKASRVPTAKQKAKEMTVSRISFRDRPMTSPTQLLGTGPGLRKSLKYIGKSGIGGDGLANDNPVVQRYRKGQIDDVNMRELRSPFGASGQRFERSFLGVKAEKFATEAHLGPGVYERPDPEAIEQRAEKQKRQARLREHIMERHRKPGEPLFPGRAQMSKHLPGSVYWSSDAPGMGTYTMPALKPVTPSLAFPPGNHYDSGSAFFAKPADAYKRTTAPLDPAKDKRTAWATNKSAAFSTDGMGGDRNAFFAVPKDARSGKIKLPYGNAPNITRGEVYDYQYDVSNAKKGMGDTIRLSKKNIYKAGLRGKGPKHDPKFQRTGSAADYAGISPAHYRSRQLDTTLIPNNSMMKHNPPPPSNKHWLRHWQGNKTEMLRYG